MTARSRPDPLLSIGVFSRRSRLSMKALRLYDRSGLLTPADVDPDTGYRRYRESQLATARLVVMLRRLNMPLAQVAEVVSAPDPVAADLLTTYWEGFERRVASQRELMSHIRSRLLKQEGRLVLWYTLDLLQLDTGTGLPWTTAHARTNLLADLVDHAVTGSPLLVPIRSTGAFMRVLEVVRTGPQATPIDPVHVDRLVGEEGQHLAVRDVEAWSERVVAEGRTFSELGAPWA